MIKEKFLKSRPRGNQLWQLQNLFQRAELVAWNFIIRVMSESTTIRLVIQESYVLVEERTRMRYILLIFAWACAGLAIGFILGFLGAIIG